MKWHKTNCNGHRIAFVGQPPTKGTLVLTDHGSQMVIHDNTAPEPRWLAHATRRGNHAYPHQSIIWPYPYTGPLLRTN